MEDHTAEWIGFLLLAQTLRIQFLAFINFSNFKLPRFIDSTLLRVQSLIFLKHLALDVTTDCFCEIHCIALLRV